MKRILTCIGFVVLLFGSLISFPSWLAWMASVWVFVGLAAAAKDKPVWPWLIGLVVVLLVKRPGWTMELWVLLLVLSAVALRDWRSRNGSDKSFNRKWLLFGSGALVVTLVNFHAARWIKTNPSGKRELDDRPIACLGDSLTDYGYPQELEKLLKVPVADFGVNGIATDDGIKMTPAILESNPQLVVIELGGHDYNGEQKTRAQTRENLVTLIETFKDANVGVVLVEIPRGFISDPYDGLERELCGHYDLKLIDDSLIRSFVFRSPIVPPGMWLDSSQHYSKDGLHPNELGNRHFARTVAGALADVFGDSILKRESVR